MPPWNEQQVLAPTPLPILSDPDRPPKVAPEDTPNDQPRVWPDYQAPGFRFGAWLFSPTLTAGTFYDSNVFRPTTTGKAISPVCSALICAATIRRKRTRSFRLNAQQTTYREHSGSQRNRCQLQGDRPF